MGSLACLATVLCLGTSLFAQETPAGALEMPTDLRQALLAMPRQDSPTAGVVVTVLDGESQAPLPNVSVFVIDPSRWQSIAPRIPREGPDLERSMLAMPWFAGQRYQADASGMVVVPKVAGSSLYAVSANGFGIGTLGSVTRPQEPVADTVEIRAVACHDYVVRTISAKGQPAPGVPVEWGPYGERGMDRFEPMLSFPTDAKGEVHFRMPGLLVRSLSGPKGAVFSAQVSVLGGPPVRRHLRDAGQDGVLELRLPPLGRVLVRLYDEQERPRAGLRSVRLRAVDGTRPNAPVSPLAAADKPQQSTDGAAHFHFVALGRKLVARITADGVAGELEHTQDGPTREGELVVFGVRVTTSSPALSFQLLDRDGTPQGNCDLSLLFAKGDTLVESRDVTSGADGRLVVALPERMTGRECRVSVWRRLGTPQADTVYGGATTVTIPAQATGLRDLGQVRLAEEPVALACRLVDDTGKALAGVVVRMDHTQAPDRGESPAFRSMGASDRRPLHHQATTDADGCFTFRELEPAARTGPLEVADGAWVLPVGTRLATGKAEQQLVVARPGTLQLSFGKKPPRHLTVEVSNATGPVRVQAQVDETTGRRTLRLPPGLYDLQIGNSRRHPLRLAGIEVRADETCTDPRLTAIDWANGQRVTTVQMRTAEGRRGGRLEWRLLDADDRSIASGSSVEDGETLLLPEGTQRIAFGNARYRTVFVDATQAVCDVLLTPRRTIRLTLPAGLELPTGIGVTAQSPFAPDAHGVWTGNGTELHIDGDDSCQIALLDKTLERSPRVVLWSGTLTVPKAGDGPATIELPLDAAAIQAIRDKLGAENRR